MSLFTKWMTRRPAKTSPVRRLELETLERRDTPSTFDLGPANLYNAYILGNFEAHGSDIEGRVAIGGNATISSYSIGDKLPNSAGTKDSLLVGGNLDFSNGQVNNGNVNTGGAANLSSFGLPNGTVVHNVTTDFIAAQTSLVALSHTYAALPVNGTVSNSFNTLTLTGTSTTLNVFTLTSDDLANCVGLQVNVPIAADVLINVTGNNVSMSNFAIWLNGPNRSEVLFNMPDTGVLNMNAIGVPASILAPNANVKFDNGQLNGTLVAWSFNGFGQMNYFPPPTTDIQNSAISGHVFEHPQGTAPACRRRRWPTLRSSCSETTALPT